MKTATALALVGLLAAMGVVAIQFGWRAEPVDAVSENAARRIEDAFAAAATAPPVAPVSVPSIVKGDRAPLGCAEALAGAECQPAALRSYKVVETRGSNYSILTRLPAFEVAELPE